MKTLRCILSSVVIFANLFLIFPVLANAQDVKYLGDICYVIDEDKPTPEGGLTPRRLGVVSFVPGHYVLTGKEGNFPISGVAYVKSDTNAIVISLYGSYGSPGDSYGTPDQIRLPDTSSVTLVVRSMTVDDQTLKGTHTDMIIRKVNGESQTITSNSGSARFFSCD